MNLAQAIIRTERGPVIDPEIAYSADHPDPEQIAELIRRLYRRTAPIMGSTVHQLGI